MKGAKQPTAVAVAVVVAVVVAVAVVVGVAVVVVVAVAVAVAVAELYWDLLRLYSTVLPSAGTTNQPASSCS